jgi:hypothetical protein
MVKDRWVVRRQQRHLFAPRRTEQNRTEQNRTEQNRTEQNRTEKMLMVKGVDELHIDPKEEFMVVKSKSHVVGERRKQGVVLMCGGMKFVKLFNSRISCGVSESVFELCETSDIMFVAFALCHRILVIIGIK